MQNIHSQHREKVLTTLHKFDPVQVGLAQQLHGPRSHRILELASRLMAALRRSHRRRVTIRALEQLADWQLKDMGILRGDIPAIVDRHLNAAPPSPRAMASRPSIGPVESTAGGATNHDQSQIAA
ncbi:MAG: DUF1127 domain-containing protein [Acidiferrobacterales bacterium]